MKGANKYLPSERITVRQIGELRRKLRKDSTAASYILEKINELQSSLRHKMNGRCVKCARLVEDWNTLCVRCGWYR